MNQEHSYIAVPNKKGGGRTEDLLELIRAAKQRSDIALDHQDDERQLQLVKIRATDVVIRELELQFGQRLIFELDRPLSY